MQARAATPEIWCSQPDATAQAQQQATQAALQQEWFERSAPLRTAIVRQQVFFPDRRLIQFDCGKLQARLRVSIHALFSPRAPHVILVIDDSAQPFATALGFIWERREHRCKTCLLFSLLGLASPQVMLMRTGRFKAFELAHAWVLLSAVSRERG